jgi:hypothetical protein
VPRGAPSLPSPRCPARAPPYVPSVDACAHPPRQAEFDSTVELGFQASTTWHQGSVVASEAGAAGRPMSSVQSCSWAFKVSPVVGWGDAAGAASGGKATAGWLSVLSVFEPHWQASLRS